MEPHETSSPVIATPWDEAFTVRSSEVEPDGRAALQAVCGYFEEAASNHALALGFSMEQLAAHGVTWVMSRLHVVVDEWPVWRQAVRVHTWPSGQDGLYARREFLLHDDEGRTLARATSAWIMIDLRRRRPTRLPAFIHDILMPDPRRALDDDFPRLPAPETTPHTQAFRVRYSDLDVNGHVNNVRYVEWALETLPRAYREARQLAELEVHYRAETGYGETVEAGAGEGRAEGILLHRLCRAEDGSEVARVRTRWVAR